MPFGEYVPDRSFWRQFAPDLIDLIGREYTPGTTDAVLDIGSAKTGGRSVLAGIAICFDIVDDELMTGMVDEGAQLHVRADQQRRLRAHRRERAAARDRAHPGHRDRRASVVNISTVGTSAIIYPDGSMHHQLDDLRAGRHGRRRAR